MWKIFKKSIKEKPKDIIEFVEETEISDGQINTYYYTRKNEQYVPGSISSNKQIAWTIFNKIKNKKPLNTKIVLKKEFI